MFVCGCLFYQQIHSQHQLNLCYLEYSCEHKPVLERAVDCFQILICGILLRASKQKRCQLPHLWLVKVKVLKEASTYVLDLTKLLFPDISCNFLIMVLITIVSFSLSSNKFGNNFNCDGNLLVSMSSPLISNKKNTILQLIGFY